VEDKNEVLQYYPLMDLNILASTTDGFGLTLVESMAMGTPVIGTNYAGIKDVIQHEENGLLYNFTEIDALVHQIERLIENEEIRSKLIENGKKTAFEKYAVENTIKNHHDFFQEVIDKKVGDL
jgi:glycosyltransferase involved in cell wall biosynthesis